MEGSMRAPPRPCEIGLRASFSQENKKSSRFQNLLHQIY